MFFNRNFSDHPAREQALAEKRSLHEAFFSSLVVGLAETYFIAYALHLGVSVIKSGLLASFPLLIAGLSPFVFRSVFHRFSNSAWVLIAALLQALAVALLALIGAFSFRADASSAFYTLMGVFSLYWFGSYSALPSWNRWIAEVISAGDSDRYFSARSRRVQWGAIIGLVVGGLTLHLNVLHLSTTLMFVMIFLVAYHFKIVAFYFLYRQPKSTSRYELSWRKAVHFLKRHQGFFTFYSIFNFTLYLSSPFVAGYLLTVRGLPYEQFMWVMAAYFAGKILTTYFLDHFKKDWSPHQMYFWGALVAAPLTAFWPVCDTVILMCLLHFISGLGWAAWEVGMSLTIFKKINGHEKIEAVTVYNMLGLPTQVLGAVVGAFLLKYFMDTNYATLFVLAGISRVLFALPLYFQKFGEK